LLKLLKLVNLPVRQVTNNIKKQPSVSSSATGRLFFCMLQALLLHCLMNIELNCFCFKRFLFRGIDHHYQVSHINHVVVHSNLQLVYSSGTGSFAGVS